MKSLSLYLGKVFAAISTNQKLLNLRKYLFSLQNEDSLTELQAASGD